MRCWKPAVVAIALALAGSGCTTIVRSSVATNGTAANAGTYAPGPNGLSNNGRYVIFNSTASNLVPDDTNGASDAFRHDNQTGATIRVSTTASGAQINGPSGAVAISGDGDTVAFKTEVAFEPADTNQKVDVYLRTISTGTIELVSLQPDGSRILGDHENELISTVTISDNGRRVLMLESLPGAGHAFFRDRDTGITTQVAWFASQALLSGDGTSMVETVLCTGGPCEYRSFITTVPIATPQVEIDDGCGFQAHDVSADARFVVGDHFGVYPTFTCPEPTGLVRWDRTTGEFVKIPSQLGTWLPVSISNDGRFVAANDGVTARVADLKTGVVQNADTGPGPGHGATISGNGRYIAFSTASKLVDDDSDDHDNVYTRYSIQPGISSVVPTSLTRGTAHATLTITGTELLGGLTVSVGGGGITVNSVTLNNPTKATVDVSVSADAAVGPRNVVVSNTGGFGHSDAWCIGCVTVA